LTKILLIFYKSTLIFGCVCFWGEIIFRRNIERRESRFRIFSRLDYPERDDANFFCFLGQRLNGSQVVFEKHNP
jgi:succinate dehydrogenase/fumarate reductase flavoprotein subunit